MSNNWNIFYSKTLNLECAFNKVENTLYVKDPDIEYEKESDIKIDKDNKKYILITYDMEELAILEGRQITSELHMLKKVFDGKIVKYNKEVENGKES